MTPMFDEFDKKLREALASEALPPDGFADRVMARVAETPQQKRTPSPARRWLLPAAACLVVAAALIPLLRSGGLGSKNASDMAADTAGDGGMMMQSAPSAGGLGDGAQQDSQQKSSLPDTDSAENSADDHAVDRAPYQSVEFAAAPSAMDDALARAADTLTAQGYTLTVTALEDGRVQASLTDAGGNAADDALTAAMETEGFAAAGDGWYTYEEDMDS